MRIQRDSSLADGKLRMQPPFYNFPLPPRSFEEFRNDISRYQRVISIFIPPSLSLFSLNLQTS